MPAALVAEFFGIDAGKKVLSGAEQDRRDGEVHFVTSPASRYCRIVATPLPRRTS